MAVQVIKGLCHLPDLVAQIPDHGLQIGHMVLGQALNLGHLADIRVLFL